MMDLHDLVEQAYTAGIQFHFYPGGALIFGTANRLAQHPELRDALRAQRDDVARYLRAMGQDSANNRGWTDHYRLHDERSTV